MGRFTSHWANVAGIVQRCHTGCAVRQGKLFIAIYFIAIYNDTGAQSARWSWIKRTYNSLPRFLRTPFALAVIAPQEIKAFVHALATLRALQYMRSWTRSEQGRGMSRWRDIVDWVGGYPYEVAAPEEIFDFFRARGFMLTKLKCGGVGLGCNEFIFVKNSDKNLVDGD